MDARLVRLRGEAESRWACRRIGRLVEDPNLRGWAFVTSVEPSAAGLLRGALERSRVLLLSGPAGTAFVGDLFALHAAGQALESLENMAIRELGARLRSDAAAVDGTPAPLLLGRRTFDWARPVVMGIVNVTPDSFSDGGRFLESVSAVAHGLRLAAEGAELLDVGGESTRPRGAAYGAGARTIAVEEELARVVPVIRELRARTDVPISIDTRKAAVARAALEAGATLVNDVSGLLHDPALADVVAEAGAALCLMHTPRDLEALAHEEESADVVGDVLGGLRRALELARRAGVEEGRLLVDPGLGFGKTRAGNLSLLGHLETIVALGRPVVVGASRKATVGWAAAGDGATAPVPVEERLAASVAAAVAAFHGGAHVLRVHDVRETVHALRVAAAIRDAGP